MGEFTSRIRARVKCSCTEMNRKRGEKSEAIDVRKRGIVYLIRNVENNLYRNNAADEEKQQQLKFITQVTKNLFL